MKCNNIDKCEWWFCREKKLCLLHEQEVRGKPTLQIYVENKNKNKRAPKVQTTVLAKPISGIRRKVYERDNYTCVFCGSKENLTLDHVFPKSLGGNRSLKNLQTLWFPCNKKKSNKFPYEL